MIGSLAAILTTASFIPQAIKVIKTKDTSGISLIMYSMFTIGVFLWIIHGFIINDLAVILANSCTFIFAVIILFFKIKYKDGVTKENIVN
ncbi:SemiSWEET transporter [Clostridium sp. LIBA-8841]|uniref:SemiSWEET transporter n=1 Tax=Clostridium sp. LIBA-8841 TaxID=2987530 RepID=UPI002AC42B4A|nr:SemiSWEET transporter [Clostridium sp. LIBA-8841]MDZ5255232.1 SemiSWEET transporter [Clostridium sp. LIBA-8841]